MALTETIQLPLGIAAPAFNLPDVKDNQSKTLEELKGKKGTLVAFICNHCPYVQHVLPQFTAMANSYLKEGVQTI
ncbi:MAG: redoxin family protein, partial [Luteibaculum sp.]